MNGDAKQDSAEASRYRTWSGLPLRQTYRPGDVAGVDYERDVGDAGKYPYTRGIHPDMYRGQFWTHREICGFGGPGDTNGRAKFLLAHGNTGLNIIFDQPHMMGIDPDHPRAKGCVGMMGVNAASLRDFEVLFDSIAIEQVNVSLINPTASAIVTTAFYVALAENRGLDVARLKGSIQNDPLHCRYFGYAPSSPFELAVKSCVDIIEYCCRNMPRWYVATFNSHGWRETGISAPQEIAFCFARVLAYLREALRRGLNIDDFGPRIGFYSSVHMDFFEEIAKLRAARRLWARIAREQLGARDPRTMQFRFGIHTVANCLTPQQPLINIARVAIQSLAAVLAGVQSLQACPYDEPICLPTEQSHRIALRTQQIVAHETGVTKVSDPLGGGYYLEALTDQMEREILKIMDEIEAMGGMVAAMKSGWIETQMEKAAVEEQRRIETKEQLIVGLNEYITEDEAERQIPIHRRPEGSEESQVASVQRVRAERDAESVAAALATLTEAQRRGENVLPATIEAAKAYATIGELMGAVRVGMDLSYDPMSEVVGAGRC